MSNVQNQETKGETCDGSAALDVYGAAGRGSSVVFTPIQAPNKLKSTEKDTVFEFFQQFDQYLQLIQDRRLAGEEIVPVELIRCLEPGLYGFLKDYILEPTRVKLKDQRIWGQHSSEEIRAYLNSIVEITSENLSVDDVL